MRKKIGTYVFILVLVILFANCKSNDNNNGDDGGVEHDTNSNIIFCNDPDDPNCEDMYICTSEADIILGKPCKKPADFPDDDEWICEETVNDDLTITTKCKKTGTLEDGSYDDGWNCYQDGEFVVCEKDRTNEGLPDMGEDGRWECEYDGEFRVCKWKEDDGWECRDDEDNPGHRICTYDNPRKPNDEDDWDCYHYQLPDGSIYITCEGTPTAEEEYGWDCVDLGDGKVRCQTQDNNLPDDDYEGEWDCYYDEFGVLVCEYGDSEEQLCIPSTKRWCDGPTYCFWGYQICLPDGRWEDTCHEYTSVEDRPNTQCACRHPLFTPICCETVDCVIPADHTPPDCTPSHDVCGYCRWDEDCTNPDYSGEHKCVRTSAREMYCGRDCTNNQPCPDTYSCVNVTNEADLKQCIPEDNNCDN